MALDPQLGTSWSIDVLIISNFDVQGGSGADVIHGWRSLDGLLGDDILFGVRNGTVFSAGLNAGHDVVSTDSVGIGSIKLTDVLLSDIIFAPGSSFTPGEGFTIQLGSGSITADTQTVHTIIDGLGNVMDLYPLTGLPPKPMVPETDDTITVPTNGDIDDTRGSDVYQPSGGLFSIHFSAEAANPGDIDTVEMSAGGTFYVDTAADAASADPHPIFALHIGNDAVLRLSGHDGERGIDVNRYVILKNFFDADGNSLGTVQLWNGTEYKPYTSFSDSAATYQNDVIDAVGVVDEFYFVRGQSYFGLSGDDVIISDFAPNFLYGGTGNDLYSLPNEVIRGLKVVDDSGDDDRIVIRSFNGSDDISSIDLAKVLGSLEDIWNNTTGIEYLQSEADPEQLWSWDGPAAGTNGVVRGIPAWLSEGDSFLGSAGDDILFAMNPVGTGGQTIDAGQGNDAVAGTDAADRLFGGTGNDRLLGGDGDDHLSGDAGNDILAPGMGVDQLDGGSGNDTADYSLSSSTEAAVGVRVDLSIGRGVGGTALGDTYSSIENITGTIYADILIGNTGANTLRGLGGNDVLFGGGGGDTLDGGAGFDTVSYSNASSGVHIFLTSMRGELGDAQGDTYTNVEAAHGSQFNDMIFAGNISGVRSVLNGLGGNDILFANTNAADFIGGTGNDIASYSAFTTRVVASLNPADALGASGRTDSFSGIEGLHGGSAGDLLYGNTGANTLRGLGGNDVLFGGGGGDALDGGAGFDTASYTTASAGVRADLAAGRGFAGDALGDTYLAIEALNGSNFSDLLLGDNAANTLNGMNGDDRLVGRGGVDLLTGGDGADRFVYSATTDSGVGPGNRDIILDFSHAQGDLIDLANIDARPADAGDQAFRFLGTDAFDGNAGALRYINAGSYSVIEVDTNGDRITDMQIQVNGVNSFVAGDFIL